MDRSITELRNDLAGSCFAAMQAIVTAVATRDPGIIQERIGLRTPQVNDLIGYIDGLNLNFAALPDRHRDLTEISRMVEGTYEVGVPLADRLGRRSDAWMFFAVDLDADSKTVKFRDLYIP
jgi:hypothetical protein